MLKWENSLQDKMIFRLGSKRQIGFLLKKKIQLPKPKQTISLMPYNKFN